MENNQVILDRLQPQEPAWILYGQLRDASFEDDTLSVKDSERLIEIVRSVIRVDSYGYDGIETSTEAQGAMWELRSILSKSLGWMCAEAEDRLGNDLYTIMGEAITCLPTDSGWPEWMEQFSADDGRTDTLNRMISAEIGEGVSIVGIWDDGLLLTDCRGFWPVLIDSLDALLNYDSEKHL